MLKLLKLLGFGEFDRNGTYFAVRYFESCGIIWRNIYDVPSKSSGRCQRVPIVKVGELKVHIYGEHGECRVTEMLQMLQRSNICIQV